MKIHRERIAKAQNLMAESGFDLLAIFPSSNMLYFSGFYDEPGERLFLLLVPQEGEPVFIVPQLYEDQLRQATPFADIRVWRDSDDPTDLLKRTVFDFGIGKGQILVDDGMWASFLLMLEEALPQANFFLASQVMVKLRIRKNPDEIHYLEEASAIADRAFEEILQMGIAGMDELDLAAALEETMRRMGAEKIAFETLVASGPNSSLPHYRAGRRVITPGDVVILDFGCQIKGYRSDITRTIICGKPSNEIKTIYEIIKAAQEKAVQTVKPGIEAQEIDRAARKMITKAGYGKQFIHRTGHGIGLDVHEEPYIAEGNQLQLQEGMTFSVEPGIYLSGRFGIRIEDIVVVTKDGVRSLNKCTHALQRVK
jgi:Xaa-Pro aminopeptidase